MLVGAMLLGSTIYTVLLYGSLAIAGISVLVWLAQRETRARTRDLPAARIRGAGAHLRVAASLYLAPALVLAGCASAYALYTRASDVWIVTDGDRGPSVDEAKYFGSPRDVFEMAPSAVQPSPYSSEDAWVINRASRTVRVETVSYGNLGFGGGTPDLVPTGTALPVYGIEYIGPTDPPPREIMASGVEAQMGMSSRRWLTWDR